MLKCKYKCRRCGLDTEVEVRERAKNEDVVNYVHHCGNAAGVDHRLRSPYCPAQECDLMIPFTQNGIGFPGPELTEEQKADIDQQLKQG